MKQIVLPGVGFDLIALRFTEGKKVKVFELDQVDTLNIKVETIKKARIKHDWITYVPVVYENESWADKLLEAGFDKIRKRCSFGKVSLIFWRLMLSEKH